MSLPRVLCVDDEPEVLEGLALALHGRYETELAGSGAEGLQRLEAGRRIDLVVSDLQMPGMDGVEFLERARALSPRVPRLLLTGHGSVAMAAAAVNRGAISRFLQKPCERDALLEAVAETLAEAARSAATQAALEQRADEVFQRLVQAERQATLGVVAGAIGSELANVTVAFDAALDMLADTARQGDPARPEELEILRRVGQHLASHGHSLRHLGERAWEPAGAADLGAAASAALELLRLSGVLRHAEVVVELPEAPLLVPLQATRVEQVVLTLLRNAEAAMAEMTGRPARLVIRVAAGPAAEEATLTIEDNGAGIAPEKLARLFDPPSRLAARRQGLGLFVARHLVESRRGRLQLTSREGRGTRVEVTLPRVRPARAP